MEQETKTVYTIEERKEVRDYFENIITVKEYLKNNENLRIRVGYVESWVSVYEDYINSVSQEDYAINKGELNVFKECLEILKLKYREIKTILDEEFYLVANNHQDTKKEVFSKEEFTLFREGVRTKLEDRLEELRYISTEVFTVSKMITFTNKLEDSYTTKEHTYFYEKLISLTRKCDTDIQFYIVNGEVLTESFTGYATQ